MGKKLAIKEPDNATSPNPALLTDNNKTSRISRIPVFFTCRLGSGDLFRSF